ncbi:uncharacterized protein LOC107636014 [Arachis ipaensis]|uniref:uncharacterized protein LOC107636014 n=1 Tax=Arachis ipaensis TaxID=130454 RepID=UPI0007AFC095|nr:uncharacterized protein LOC107636014 [Arachis ipaensis]
MRLLMSSSNQHDGEINRFANIGSAVGDESEVNIPNDLLITTVDDPLSFGLCNGIRLIVNELDNNIIGVTVVTGRNIGNKVYIPRMNLVPSNSGLPFKFQLRQFSLTVCFAMTVNKSQGKSLSHVGLYLPKSMFTHG